MRVQETNRLKAGRLDPQVQALVEQHVVLCAMAALRVNPDLRAWRERLRARGKPGQVVMIALTRQMLHLASGVWKNDCDDDPTRAFAVMA